MIRTRKDLHIYLKEDARRNGLRNSYFRYLVRLLCCKENALVFRYLKTLRFCEYYYNQKFFLHKLPYYYYAFKRSRLGSKYHIEIPLNKTGYGLRIAHLSGGGGVLLGVNKVGNYCGFNTGVLLGISYGEKAAPTLGDYVEFGPGAKAFGDITIGNNVFVAPNSVVRKDVPSNCIVGGVPAKILKYLN